MKAWVLTMALCSAALPAWAEGVARQITVMGEGIVHTVPDIAVISVGVTQQDKDAATAMARASQAAGAVLAKLRDLGIEPRDLQTSQIDLSPVYTHRQNEEPSIDAYRASLELTVRVRDLPALGGILGAVVQDGANRFSGLHFSVSDRQAAEDAARAAAVADALRKAGLLAQAAGVKLGPVVSIQENGGGGGVPMMRMAADMAPSPVPVAEGEVALQQSVTLVIELQ